MGVRAWGCGGHSVGSRAGGVIGWESGAGGVIGWESGGGSGCEVGESGGGRESGSRGGSDKVGWFEFVESLGVGLGVIRGLILCPSMPHALSLCTFKLLCPLSHSMPFLCLLLCLFPILHVHSPCSLLYPLLMPLLSPCHLLCPFQYSPCAPSFALSYVPSCAPIFAISFALPSPHYACSYITFEFLPLCPSMNPACAPSVCPLSYVDPCFLLYPSMTIPMPCPYASLLYPFLCHLCLSLSLFLCPLLCLLLFPPIACPYVPSHSPCHMSLPLLPLMLFPICLYPYSLSYAACALILPLVSSHLCPLLCPYATFGPSIWFLIYPPCVPSYVPSLCLLLYDLYMPIPGVCGWWGS